LIKKTSRIVIMSIIGMMLRKLISSASSSTLRRSFQIALARHPAIDFL
jgi:hypothetical protein